MTVVRRALHLSLALALIGGIGACPSGERETTAGRAGRPACDPNDGGLTLPDGFCALVVARDLGRVRHIAVRDNGDIFVALGHRRGDDAIPVGLLALRDTSGDGVADVQLNLGGRAGTGVWLHDGELYFAPDDRVLRFDLAPGALEPQGEPDTIVSGLPSGRSHAAKSIAVSDDGWLYVNIGAPSNACQERDRVAGSPGRDPCPLLEGHGGIWRFRTDRTGQSQTDGERFATGLRNVVALTLHPTSGDLYGVMHGRDQLHGNWPERYTEEESAHKPSEEFLRIQQGDDFGWPYCYHDPERGRLVLGPEYGGDGQEVGRCTEVKEPLKGFPAHWGPDGLTFYSGRQFPDRYRSGAFIAFHGSWNRAPLPQAGYHVVFQPMRNGNPAGDHEIFAEGFAGGRKGPDAADHRPVGVAVGPDGSLYVTDDQAGWIWRIMYKGG